MATLDSEVLDQLKSKKICRAKFPGKVNHKSVVIPQYIESSILDTIAKHDALNFYKESKKFGQIIFRRTPILEGFAKQNIMEKFKHKLLESMEKDIDINDYSKEALVEKINKKMENYDRFLGNLHCTINYDKKNSLLYLMSRAPFEYAALVKIFQEICKKDPAFRPETLLDFGSGVGTVVWAAKEQWESSLMEYVTVDSSESMNALAYKIIYPEYLKNPIIKGLIQKRYFPAGDINFDIVVSAFTFFDLGNYEQRMQHLNDLWNLTSKYLVLVENGTEYGFNMIKEARDMVLQQSMSLNFRWHVVAPCPHDFICPIERTEDKACRFLGRYKELNLKRGILHGDRPYSYVILKKERRSKEDKQWPRIIKEVLSRRKQLICRFCTNEGQVKEISISKGSYDRETYEFSKWLKWGDCFPGTLCTVEKSRKERKLKADSAESGGQEAKDEEQKEGQGEDEDDDTRQDQREEGKSDSALKIFSSDFTS